MKIDFELRVNKDTLRAKSHGHMYEMHLDITRTYFSESIIVTDNFCIFEEEYSRANLKRAFSKVLLDPNPQYKRLNSSSLERMPRLTFKGFAGLNVEGKVLSKNGLQKILYRINKDILREFSKHGYRSFRTKRSLLLDKNSFLEER